MMCTEKADPDSLCVSLYTLPSLASFDIPIMYDTLPDSEPIVVARLKSKAKVHWWHMPPSGGKMAGHTNYRNADFMVSL